MGADDAFNIVIFIFILSIITQLGLTAAYKSNHDAREESYKVSQDKNTQMNRGYNIRQYGTYDGYMNMDEIALASQIQNYERLTESQSSAQTSTIRVENTAGTYGLEVSTGWHQYDTGEERNLRLNAYQDAVKAVGPFAKYEIDLSDEDRYVLRVVQP